MGGAPTFDEGGATTQHDGREEGAPQVHVRLLDGVGQHLMNTGTLVSDQVGSEEQLRSSEAGRSDLHGRPEEFVRAASGSGGRVVTDAVPGSS